MAALPELRDPSLPGVWRASELGQGEQRTLGTGEGELDRELPGGGWPQGSLTEILQAQPGLHEWRLLLPALRQAADRGTLVLIAPPHLPNLPALACQGVAAGRILRIEARTPAERLWAAEQALRCRELGALLAWLPQARPEQLRRLHLASQASPAAQPPLVFAFRPIDARHESSPAPLRVALQGQGSEGLALQVLKRRGPAMEHPMVLAAPLPVTPVLRRVQTSTAMVQKDLSDAPIRNPDHVVDRPRPAERHIPTARTVHA